MKLGDVVLLGGLLAAPGCGASMDQANQLDNQAVAYTACAKVGDYENSYDATDAAVCAACEGLKGDSRAYLHTVLANDPDGKGGKDIFLGCEPVKIEHKNSTGEQCATVTPATIKMIPVQEVE